MTTAPRPHPVMAALGRRLPIALLIDLIEPEGPDSARILVREVADLSWLAGLPRPSAPPAGAALDAG